MQALPLAQTVTLVVSCFGDDLCDKSVHSKHKGNWCAFVCACVSERARQVGGVDKARGKSPERQGVEIEHSHSVS